jgi:hypothetical protein
MTSDRRDHGDEGDAPLARETSRLLQDEESQQLLAKAKATPLPWRQLSVICLIRVSLTAGG